MTTESDSETAIVAAESANNAKKFNAFVVNANKTSVSPQIQQGHLGMNSSIERSYQKLNDCCIFSPLRNVLIFARLDGPRNGEAPAGGGEEGMLSITNGMILIYLRPLFYLNLL